MKKILGTLAISVVLFACNNAADGTTNPDSANMNDNYSDTMTGASGMDSGMNGSDMSDKHIQSNTDTSFDIGRPDSSSN